MLRNNLLFFSAIMFVLTNFFFMALIFGTLLSYAAFPSGGYHYSIPGQAGEWLCWLYIIHPLKVLVALTTNVVPFFK